MSIKKSNLKKLFSAAMTILLLLFCAVIPVQAAYSDDGLVVEKMNFRDVLRLYTADKYSFGENAGATDEYGVSNAAKRLAELFAYTVGLNYTGEGNNSDYYGKDISGRMGTDPYVDGNLLATYNVEILPYNSTAVALADGQQTAIRVYLAGYRNAANGVEPVLHYVWQDNGIWYAVKDDNPYYSISYEGGSARQTAESGLSIMQSRACGGGTAGLEAWEDLGARAEGSGVVHLYGRTIVVGQSTANIFGVTAQRDALVVQGGFAPCLLAVSDFVQGDTTWQTGPLVYSRQCMREDNNHMVPDGEILEAGVSYRFRVVYDEALTLSADSDWDSGRLLIRNETSGNILPVNDFVWYGDSEHLTKDSFNPHVIEFSFVPDANESGVCTFVPENLIGGSSALAAASFHACLKPGETVIETGHTVPESTPTVEMVALGSETAAVSTETPNPTPAPNPTMPVLGEYDGSTPVTRLMLAKCLWALSGSPMGDIEAIFPDMPAEPFEAQAVLWVSRTGVIVGCNDGTFSGGSVLTREQTADILMRYALLRGLDISYTGQISWYCDGWQVSPWAQEAVMWAIESGILSTWNTSINPVGQALCSDVIDMITVLRGMY